MTWGAVGGAVVGSVIKGSASGGTVETTTDLNAITEEEELTTERSKTEQLTSELGLTSTLDEETQAFVKNLIGDLGAGRIDADSELLSELTTSIVERSKTAQADVTESISAITDASRLEGEQQLQSLQTQLAQQSGGSLANTLVASSTAIGRADLESKLAKQQGELTLAGREQVTQELTAALGGASSQQASQVQNISGLLSILKGSTTEQQVTGRAETSSETELARILESLTTSVESSTKAEDTFSLGLQAANK